MPSNSTTFHFGFNQAWIRLGLDVHQAMTVVAVMNADGKIVLETMVPTAAVAIREMIGNLSGPLHVTLEGITQAEWFME